MNTKELEEAHRRADPNDEVEEFRYEVDVAGVKKYKNPQPVQPVERDEKDVIRFRKNEIVWYLLENGPFDMNYLARQGFSGADKEQFAQLVGYSVSGFGSLSYVSDDTYEQAVEKVEEMEDDG